MLPLEGEMAARRIAIVCERNNRIREPRKSAASHTRAEKPLCTVDESPDESPDE